MDEEKLIVARMVEFQMHKEPNVMNFCKIIGSHRATYYEMIDTGKVSKTILVKMLLHYKELDPTYLFRGDMKYSPYTNLNCLEYSLIFCSKNKGYEIVYNSNHAIAFKSPRVFSTKSNLKKLGYLNLKEFGYELISKSFEGLLSKRGETLLKKYFKIKHESKTYKETKEKNR